MANKDIICVAIKQNESKLELNAMDALYLELYFGENPIEIGLTVPGI